VSWHRGKGAIPHPKFLTVGKSSGQKNFIQDTKFWAEIPILGVKLKF